MLLVICFYRFERIVFGTLLGECFIFFASIFMLVMLYCCWASFEIYFLVLSLKRSFFLGSSLLDSLEDYDSVILCEELFALILELWEVCSFFFLSDLWSGFLYYLIVVLGRWLVSVLLILCEGLLLLGVDKLTLISSSLLLSWELVIKDWLKLRLFFAKSSWFVTFIIYFSFAPSLPKVSYDWLFSSASLYLTLSEGVSGFIPADCFRSAIFGMECNLEKMPIINLGTDIRTLFNEVLKEHLLIRWALQFLSCSSLRFLCLRIHITW